jgi:hypothetical protein
MKEPVGLIEMTSAEVTDLTILLHRNRPLSDALDSLLRKLSNAERIPPAWDGWTVIEKKRAAKAGGK